MTPEQITEKKQLESEVGRWCKECWCLAGSHMKDCSWWVALEPTAKQEVTTRDARVDEFMLRIGAAGTPRTIVAAKKNVEIP